MRLFYDRRDEKIFEERGARTLYWLDDVGALPIDEAKADDEGFVFAGARSIDDYRRLISAFPRLRDDPESRAPLLELDAVLATVGSVADAAGTSSKLDQEAVPERRTNECSSRSRRRFSARATPAPF